MTGWRMHPFEPFHVDGLKIRGWRWGGAFMEQRKMAVHLATPGMSWTLMHDGDVMACGGLLPLWPGRAQAWLWAYGVPIAGWGRVVRQCRRAIAEAHGRGYYRIEAQINASVLADINLIEAMGFRCEGMARQWGPAPDYADFLHYGLVVPPAADERAA